MEESSTFDDRIDGRIDDGSKHIQWWNWWKNQAPSTVESMVKLMTTTSIFNGWIDGGIDRGIKHLETGDSMVILDQDSTKIWVLSFNGELRSSFDFKIRWWSLYPMVITTKNFMWWLRWWLLYPMVITTKKFHVVTSMVAVVFYGDDGLRLTTR